ncbi:24685_t:CDS:2 [Dentiscutata erythropus]|uniref:Protein BCP1 n=1 Tax=Dentiscutata erythropus TaxID=1348616 RepID=A0A9N9G444_9GLOM|nr:24685_t:CDS:2 [Dentiscutata erythropus]
MGKRKANKNEDPIDSATMDVSEEDTEDSDEGVSDGEENSHLDEEIVDIDFDFFDPKPIDFHSIKNLMIQLFSTDAELFSISELTELIIDQPLLGTTVKVDGADSDPYAILTVLNMNEHLEKKCIQDLIKYLLDKTKPDQTLNEKLDTLLKKDSTNHVGLMLSERLINMPVQIVPPMYKMLQEEIQWAVDDNEPYNFEWYLVLSKTYQEVMSTLDDESSQSKKQKKKKAKSEPTVFYFHPEDEVIERNSEYQFNFNFTKQPSVSDSKRAFSDFGIAPAMKLFLLNRSKFDNLVRDLENACK